MPHRLVLVDGIRPASAGVIQRWFYQTMLVQHWPRVRGDEPWLIYAQIDMIETKHLTMQLPVPFRLQSRVTSAELINAVYAVSGDSIDIDRIRRMQRNSETELEAIAQTRTPTFNRLACWFLHLDERVAIAAVRARYFRSNWRSKKAEILFPLALRRALMDAEAHGEVWNPLLDALSETGVWHNNASAGSPSLDRYLNTHVVPVLADIHDAQVLRGLIKAYRSPYLVQRIAIAAPTMPLDLVQDILTACPDAVVSLARRAQLPADVRDYLLEFVVDAAANFSPTTGPVRASSINTAAWSLIHQHDANLSSDQFEQLCRARFVKQEDEGCGAGYLMLTAYWVLRAYLSKRTDDDAWIRFISLVRSAKDASDRVQALIRLRLHENIPVSPRLIDSILEHGLKISPLFPKLAKFDHLRASPGFRRALLRSSSMAVVKQLLLDRRPEEFRALFRKLSRVSPMDAAQILQDCLEIAKDQLRVTDLTPLLSASDPTVRMTAITLLPEFSTVPSSKRGLDVSHPKQRFGSA